MQKDVLVGYILFGVFSIGFLIFTLWGVLIVLRKLKEFPLRRKINRLIAGMSIHAPDKSKKHIHDNLLNLLDYAIDNRGMLQRKLPIAVNGEVIIHSFYGIRVYHQDKVERLERLEVFLEDLQETIGDRSLHLDDTMQLQRSATVLYRYDYRYDGNDPFTEGNFMLLTKGGDLYPSTVIEYLTLTLTDTARHQSKINYMLSELRLLLEKDKVDTVAVDYRVEELNQLGVHVVIHNDCSVVIPAWKHNPSYDVVLFNPNVVSFKDMCDEED